MTITATFPDVTPQATSLLMSEAEILESIKKEDLFTSQELCTYIYNLDINFAIPDNINDYELNEEEKLEDHKANKEDVLSGARYPISFEEQFRSLQTCRHAYHLYKIGLFNMDSWATETECGTSMCIGGSAAALYGELDVDDYGYCYPTDRDIIGKCWTPIYFQNNEVGLEAIRFVLNKAQERGFLSFL